MYQAVKEYLYENGVMKKSVRICAGVIIFAILLAGTLYLYYNRPEEKVWLICIVRELTGYYCPGCGAGRASYALLHGQLYQAFRYNPLLIILLPWLGLYVASCVIQWVLTGRESISRRIPVWIPYVVLIILLVYGIVRNIDTYPFVLLAPTKV